MRFVIALVISFALIWLCAKPLKKYPVPFYLGAIVLLGLYFWGSATGVRNEIWSYFQPLMQRCALAFLLFSIVMFVGVLGEKNPLRTHLMPIRRQLSILACIFAVGHIAFYVLTYVHLALLLMPSALAGNDVAVLSIAVYSIVMGAYVVLRLRKALADRRTEATAATPDLDLEAVAA